MNTKHGGMPTGLLAMVGMILLAASPLAMSALPGEADTIDEVAVRGMATSRMRAKLVELEDRFYALYNQLNQDKDFAVHCYTEAPLGTRLKRRACRVAYVEAAQAEWAQSIVSGLQDGLSGMQNAPMPELVELMRQDEYRKNALKVINSDQRLLKLVRERESLQKRYVAELKRRQK